MNRNFYKEKMGKHLRFKDFLAELDPDIDQCTELFGHLVNEMAAEFGWYKYFKNRELIIEGLDESSS